MNVEIDIKITVKKKPYSWQELKKFEDEFSKYCKFMGYCPLIIYEPGDCGRSLCMTIKGGNACGFPHISDEEFVEALNDVFPKYVFDLDF